MTAQLAVDAQWCSHAAPDRGLRGRRLHSARRLGQLVSCTEIGHALNRHGMVGSRRLGRGQRSDGELRSLLQTNVPNQRRWATRQEFRLALVVRIERKDHRERPQDSLSGLTPRESEAHITAPPSRPNPNCHRLLPHAHILFRRCAPDVSCHYPCLTPVVDIPADP